MISAAFTYVKVVADGGDSRVVKAGEKTHK